MPKMIGDAKSNILITAKAQLLSNGYHKLSLRSIAKECGIAVGTIYNYFPSKDILVASIMVEDWKKVLDCMKNDCENADNLALGFLSIYNGITNFSDIYRHVWSEYSFAGNTRYSFPDQHKLLRNQIAKIVQDLLKRYGKNEGEPMSVFLAESLLTTAMQEDMQFEILLVVIERLFK